MAHYHAQDDGMYSTDECWCDHPEDIVPVKPADKEPVQIAQRWWKHGYEYTVIQVDPGVRITPSSTGPAIITLQSIDNPMCLVTVEAWSVDRGHIPGWTRKD